MATGGFFGLGDGGEWVYAAYAHWPLIIVRQGIKSSSKTTIVDTPTTRS
jgi:hypothetical protein